MKLPEPVAWMDRDGDVYKELPTPYWHPPHQALFSEAQLREALAQQTLNMGNSHITQCQCKDRPASECPGAWEPGCDLGNNEAHAVPVNQCDECMTGQAMRRALHIGDDGKPLMVFQKSKYEAENEANERNLCQLTDELAACRKDATRYQWLRSHPIVFGHGSLTVFMDDRCGSGSTHKQVWKSELDAAIDKQLEKEQ